MQRRICEEEAIELMAKIQSSQRSGDLLRGRQEVPAIVL
jgi:hypothetical protein